MFDVGRHADAEGAVGSLSQGWTSSEAAMLLLDESVDPCPSDNEVRRAGISYDVQVCPASGFAPAPTSAVQRRGTAVNDSSAFGHILWAALV